MVTRLSSRQRKWMFRLVRLWCAGALFIAFNTPSWARAQVSNDSWAGPLNLSHSGLATNPSIVIDSEAVVHAVWQDDLANFIYARLDGEKWSSPETTDLNVMFGLPPASESSRDPDLAIYTGPNPLFIAGPGQYVFAFWISPDAKLFTSRVENKNFKDSAGWRKSGRAITPAAASFAVAVDAQGEWHVAYFSIADDPANPAGIYYTRSQNGGGNWAVPVLLYESSYLRRLGAGEANLSVATTGTEDALRVFVAWDNRPRKQVLLAQSADGGVSWEQPALIAGPAPGAGSSGPFSIHVGANQNSVVLIWQSGETGGECNQIYQSSRDGGATWSDPQPMIEGLLGCTESNQFVTRLANNPKDPLYFLIETKSQVFLTVWNGLQWSQPEAQPILSGFEEPEIYTEVILGCHRSSLLGERLYIVGCDQAGGGDIWITSRELGSNTSLSKPLVWSQLMPVTSEDLEMEAVEVVSTDDGSIHVFFSQHQDPAIYYTYWDGELWSRITPVLELPEGDAAWPAIAAGPENELFLIARNNRGTLYFSRAASGNAATKSSWSTPTRPGIGHDGDVGSVDVAWDAAGTVYVAYSVPVGEQRGIYLVQSNDRGTTWSEPLQVFDGAAAGFDLVGAPSLLLSASGLLHVIWKEQSIQGDGFPQPLSLYYTRSEDGGHTFNVAEMVVEEPVAWREMVTDDNGNLHLLWQPDETLTTVWDQISLDGGHTWQYPQGLLDAGSLAAITRDPAGTLHLMGIGPGAVGHWLWDGSRWQSEAPPGWPMSSQEGNQVELLAATVNKQGKMLVVLAESTGKGDAAAGTLLYSARTLELPRNETAVQDVPTQTMLPPTRTPAPPTAERSPTPASTVDSEPANSQSQADRNETNNRVSPFTISLVSVALLLLSVMGMVIRQAARDKDR